MFEIKLYVNKDEQVKMIDETREKNFLSSNGNDIMSTNDLYETLNCRLSIFREKSENLSLTDKCEFFRFFPIKRNNIILIFAIPEELSQENFISFIQSYINKIKFIRFINHNIKETNFLKAIIYFYDQDSADNFYFDFNTRSYPTNKYEYMYCAFVSSVTFTNEDDISIGPIWDKSELFSCPLCLEKLDDTSTGVHTIINLMNVDRWEHYRKNCAVCSKIHSNYDCVKCSTDNKSNVSNTIWCCMICSFIACDRYRGGHGVEHFDMTLHRYSIDLKSQRIWDYLGDTWVHRVIKINPMHEESSDGTIVLQSIEKEEQELSSKEFLMRIENIISEYNHVLSSQLEEQQKYYDKEISKVKDSFELRMKEKRNEYDTLKEKIEAKRRAIDTNNKLYSGCLKKIKQQENRIQDLKKTIELNYDLMKTVENDIKREPLPEDDKETKMYKEMLSLRLLKKAELEKELEQYYNILSNKK